MNLLYLCHCLPYPPNKGDRVRAYHALKSLADVHSVHLMALVKPDEDVNNSHPLESFCASVAVFPIGRASARARSLLALVGAEPLTLAYFRSAQLRRAVRNLVGMVNLDAVVAYSSAMVPYVNLIPDTPVLVDLVDVDSAKWTQYAQHTSMPQSWVYEIEANRLRAFEGQLGSHVDRAVVTTDKEARLLREIVPEVPTAVIRNGVSEKFLSQPSTEEKSSVPTIVFVGQMDYLPNVQGAVRLATSLLSRIRAKSPDTEVLIVGRSPSPEVKRLSRIDGVTVTGEVADVRPFLGRAWVFAAPLAIAQGVQNKVLEAMAMSLPVVCSSAVMSGIKDSGFIGGGEILVADQDNDFAGCILDLLNNESRRLQIGRQARLRVERFYSWERNFDQFEQLVSEIVRDASMDRGGGSQKNGWGSTTSEHSDRSRS